LMIFDYEPIKCELSQVTPEECQGVKHHLLSVLNPKKDRWTVRDFRDNAIKVINDMHSRDLCPVVVGGSMYYVQSLLWPTLVDDSNYRIDGKDNSDYYTDEDEDDSKYTYDRLKELDPEMAQILHPNNIRKIKRSIKVFEETGRKHSDIMKEQKKNRVHTDLRYNCMVLWLTCDLKVHRERLSGRVDQMMNQGLLDEARDFLGEVDKVEGDQIEFASFQSIGYKEFRPHLFPKEGEDPVSLETCVEALKAHHRQYARRQNRWIKNKILPRNAPVFQLDTSDVKAWSNLVRDPAMELTKQFLQANEWDPDKVTLPQHVERANVEEREKKDLKRRECEICDGLVVIGELAWEVHLSSKRHRRQKKKLRKETEREKYLEEYRNKRANHGNPDDT